MIRKADGTIEEFDEDSVGVPVGVIEDYPYDVLSRSISPGETVLFYTDGVSEAMTAAGDEWGEERFIQAARECRDLVAAEIITHLMAGADAFTAGAPQHDDMTLVVVKLGEEFRADG
jgi:sigma-B regulation protein RsbU (phosphoserine phosphatase)